MKRNIIVSILMLFSIISFSQTFEGEIVYSNTYKSKSAQFTDERWTMLLGDVQNYFIKSGDYKSITNGKLMQWQLYINKDNNPMARKCFPCL